MINLRRNDKSLLTNADLMAVDRILPGGAGIAVTNPADGTFGGYKQSGLGHLQIKYICVAGL